VGPSATVQVIPTNVVVPVVVPVIVPVVLVTDVVNPVPVKVTSMPGGPNVGFSVMDGVARTGVKRLVDAVVAMKADRTKSNVTTSLARRRIKPGHTSLCDIDLAMSDCI